MYVYLFKLFCVYTLAFAPFFSGYFLVVKMKSFK